jgi:hypothetical protein
MTTLPMMSGGQRPTIGEAAGMVAIPLVASLAAVVAARRRRRWLLLSATAVAGLFALVTGFSFGGVLLPTFGLLVWAVVASIDADFGHDKVDTAV